MKQRGRHDLGRRLERLEETFEGAVSFCRCGLPPGSPPWARHIALAGPGDDASPDCPDCGRERIVTLLAFKPDLAR